MVHIVEICSGEILHIMGRGERPCFFTCTTVSDGRATLAYLGWLIGGAVFEDRAEKEGDRTS